MRRELVCLAAVLLLAAAPALGAELVLKATKDARIMGHASEVGENGGKSARLRMVGITRGGAEFVILDFDRAALKTFLENNKDKEVTGKLVVVVREVQGADDKVKVEAASIDCAVDWNEGERSQQKAEKGECCASWAQAEDKKWTTVDGKEVGQFREMVYDGKKVTTVLNSGSVEVTKDDGDKTKEIPLDANFVKHVGTSDKCRGVFLFIQDNKAKVDIFSREQAQKSASLVVAVK